MSRFLLAWEMGGGLGHLMPLAGLARELLQRGHRVDFVVKDLGLVSQVLGDLLAHPGMRIWQTPVWLAPLNSPMRSITFAELMFVAGFLDASGKLAQVKAWRSLVEAIAPDVLVIDAAPTLLLSARHLPIPKMLMGSGFFIPPNTRPLPMLQPVAGNMVARCLASEARVLDCCNEVLGALKEPALASLSELIYSANHACVLGWPELDAYPDRPPDSGVTFCGPMNAVRGEVAPLPGWSEGNGDLPCFAYLHCDGRPLAAILSVLQRGTVNALVYAPSLPPREFAKWQGDGLRFVASPVDMAAVTRKARLIVCHAGEGTVYAALSAGLPLLMLPMQGEQQMRVQRVERLGCGLGIALDAPEEQIENTLLRLLTEDSHARNARALAARWADRSRVAFPDIADRLEQALLRQAGPVAASSGVSLGG